MFFYVQILTRALYAIFADLSGQKVCIYGQAKVFNPQITKEFCKQIANWQSATFAEG